jgi:hypothetical protein
MDTSPAAVDPQDSVAVVRLSRPLHASRGLVSHDPRPEPFDRIYSFRHVGTLSQEK